MSKKASVRLLLADDHPIVRAGIRQFLELEPDFEVIAEAENGLDAEDKIEVLKPDVAILDIRMPKATGIEVTRFIRSRNLQVGVLILTAYEDEPYITAALRAGANGYILKNADSKDIVNAVRDVYLGKKVMDQAILSKMLDSITAGSEYQFIKPLTDREMDILRLAAKGQTNRAIANQLSLSNRTVQGHFARIFKKMQATSRTDAVVKAVAMGLISPIIGQEE